MSDYLKALALSSALSLASAPTQAAPPQGIRLVDARHKAIALPRPAQRIVSLQPSFTEAICALGGCHALVGVDRYSSWPMQATTLPQVGSIRDPDIERIIALKPDVVLARPNHRVDERLERLGITVLTLNAQTYEDMERELETLAQLLGCPGDGTRLWRQTRERLEALRRQMPAQWQGKKVYFELHSGMAAAGEASFIGQTLHNLGLVNIAGRDLPMYPKLSPEYVVRANPDLIITMADLPVPPPERQGWSRVTALRGNHYCRIPNAEFDVLVRPGPRIDEAARHIVQCLQRMPLPAGGMDASKR
ncbi:MAG: helical backbone metal receptor [Acidovorax sp.]|jgi:iron complex transport system substrate-binding protein|nr:helical backbone metal receptor [Acidovorax sp.]